MISKGVWNSSWLPVRFLCPWDSPGKNTAVDCYAFLQGIFLTQGSNRCLLRLLHWQGCQVMGEAGLGVEFVLSRCPSWESIIRSHDFTSSDHQEDHFISVTSP
ncbi:hypothetical protein R6Z07F_006003 [Ovis aries]